MGKIKVTGCDIEGLYVIEPTVFKDERGYFVETYNYNDFAEAGLDMKFVQDNQSMSEGRFSSRISTLIRYPCQRARNCSSDSNFSMGAGASLGNAFKKPAR